MNWERCSSVAEHGSILKMLPVYQESKIEKVNVYIHDSYIAVPGFQQRKRLICLNNLNETNNKCNNNYYCALYIVMYWYALKMPFLLIGVNLIYLKFVFLN